MRKEENIDRKKKPNGNKMRKKRKYVDEKENKWRKR